MIEIKKLMALLGLALVAAIAFRVWWDWYILPSLTPATYPDYDSRIDKRMGEVKDIIKRVVIELCFPVAVFFAVLIVAIIWVYG